MARREKLREKAQNSPHNLRFEELCKLAGYYGWMFDRQNGSHAIYINPALPDYDMNFQDRKGHAKPSQIRQLLEAIEELE